VAALRAGKHVFVEKPLCRSRRELSEIRSAADGRHLGCNLVLRAAPLYRWLREAIAAGELGTIYAFDGDYLYGRLEKITHGWRKNVEAYSVLQGGGVHLIDLMLWLTGQRPVRVSAAGSRIATAGSAFRYHDFVAATFVFSSGMVGRITANFASVHRHQHVLRVFGTKATFLFDDQGARLHTSRDPSASPRRIEAAPEPPEKGALVPEFMARIQSGAAPDAAHEFDVMRACLAADDALASGAPVEVA
jgi:predicted dehydrogenase